MELNVLPPTDLRDCPTGCCPRFVPGPWDGQVLRLRDKPFARASTRSVLYVPLDMGAVFRRMGRAIEGATEGGRFVLSRELSPWRAEHLFAVDHEVPGVEVVHLTGTFLTKVFEGPYARVGRWRGGLGRCVADRGRRAEQLYFYYTTCPRCAKVYGKNYVVGVAQVTPDASDAKVAADA